MSVKRGRQLSAGPIYVCMQLHAFPLSSGLPACVWVSVYMCQCLQMEHVCMHVLLHTCM